MKRILCVALVLLCGCGEAKPPSKELLPVARAISKQTEEGPLRFQIEAQGFFNGGFQGHPREIFIITDRETGKDYLAITGTGVTELWTERHNKKDVTVEE